jgi:CheY-like chemotaxis protein/HPt (histidine-containing phosphotransfer) domain-containing protein
MTTPARAAPGAPVVLVIDADRDCLRLLGTLLQPCCTVRAANSAERALRAATTDPRPELILLGLDDPALQALPQTAVLRIAKPVHAFTLLAELRDRLPGRLPAPAGTLDGRRTLVVEDDPLLQQVTCEILRDAGVGTQVAADGGKALAALEHERFDWILMDLQMPVVDGLEATRAIRADARFTGHCIIAVSGSDLEADRQACRAAGMNDFLTKPIAPALLKAKLEQWLEQSAPPAAEKSGSGDTATARILDLAALDALGQGNPARIEKYARYFISSGAASLAKIDQSLAGGDLAAARSEAHKFKSAARWVGGLALGNGCEALEKLPVDDLAAARQLAAACRVHYADLSRALIAQLPASSHPAPADPSS